MLSDEQITSYQKLYKDHFGKEISRAAALEEGTKLIRLVELISKPMTGDDYRLLEQRRRETDYYETEQ